VCEPVLSHFVCVTNSVIYNKKRVSLAIRQMFKFVFLIVIVLVSVESYTDPYLTHLICMEICPYPCISTGEDHGWECPSSFIDQSLNSKEQLNQAWLRTQSASTAMPTDIIQEEIPLGVFCPFLKGRTDDFIKQQAIKYSSQTDQGTIYRSYTRPSHCHGVLGQISVKWILPPEWGMISKEETQWGILRLSDSTSRHGDIKQYGIAMRIFRSGQEPYNLVFAQDSQVILSAYNKLARRFIIDNNPLSRIYTTSRASELTVTPPPLCSSQCRAEIELLKDSIRDQLEHDEHFYPTNKSGIMSNIASVFPPDLGQNSAQDFPSRLFLWPTTAVQRILSQNGGDSLLSWFSPELISELLDQTHPLFHIMGQKAPGTVPVTLGHIFLKGNILHGPGVDDMWAFNHRMKTYEEVLFQFNGSKHEFLQLTTNDHASKYCNDVPQNLWCS
jgi:hypothetical protein